VVRYGLSGGTAAATHFLVLTALVELGGWRPVLASAVGFGAGFVVSYTLQRRWVFATVLGHAHTLPRFLTVIGLGLALNSLVLYLGTETWSVHYAPVQVVAFALVPANNYVLNSLWTFRTP
jgi:putative flippase GtrA